MPGVQVESLATRRVNECRRFYEAKQRLQRPQAGERCRRTAGLEAEGAWRMTLRTPPGLSDAAIRGNSTRPFHVSNISPAWTRSNTCRPSPISITSPHHRSSSKAGFGNRSRRRIRYVGLTSTTTTREVTVGLTCSNPLPVEPPRTSTTFGSNSLKNLTQQATEYWPLTHGRTAHVTDIVGFRNI